MIKEKIKKLFSYQPIRFLFVGGLNTLVGYGIYALLLYLNVNYLVANTISTIIGVAHSYLWNRYFTFKSKNKAIKEITKFVSVYIASYLIGMCTLYIFKDKLNISPYIAGLLNLVITTLISYFGHKYISFRDGGNMKIINKIKSIWNDTSRINKLEISFLVILLVLCYFLFNHGDLVATSSHGRILLQSILQGKFLSFYDITHSDAVYLIPIYIFFAIWSIPVEIIFSLSGLDIVNMYDYTNRAFIILMWYKLLPVLFVFLTAVVVYKIGKILDIREDKRKWMIYVFLGFPILIFSQFVFGQYDSINMFFTTLAFYYYLQKKYYKFSILMAIAIPLKLFPIFIFIPLLLLAEKRLIQLIKYGLIGISGYLISNILFISSPAFKEASKFSGGMIERFFEHGMQTSYGFVSLFLLALTFICVLSYIKNVKDDKEYNYYSLYIVLFVYSLFFSLVLWHPQWVLLLVPIWVLTMFSFNDIKATLILSIFLCIGYLLVTVTAHAFNVDSVLIDLGILPQITGEFVGTKYSLSDLYPSTLSAYITLFTSCLVVNLIIKYPTEKRIEEYRNGHKDKDYIPEKGYIFGLILTLVIIYILPVLYVYFK